MQEDVPLSIEELPSWFRYPPEFRKILRYDLVSFGVWWIPRDRQFVIRWIRGLRERYPSRQLVPFARRGDCDTIACWELGKPGVVVLIDDYEPEGYESGPEFPDFWSWFREVIETMIEFDD